MLEKKALTLDDHDPSVMAARKAEIDLYAYYGLEAKDHYIAIPGQALKIRISEMGSGDPVLIVPGNTGDVFPLAALLTEIKGRRIIALNRPGGGLSDGMDHTQVDIRDFAVKTVVAAMDAFHLEKADIVAHSMGAHWSLWTAMDRPERVRSLTLLGNPGNVMGGKPPLLMRLMIRWPLKRLPHYFISQTSLLQNAAPAIDAQQLSQVKQPAQLLLGDKDTFAPVATGRSIAAAMAGCTLHVIKDGSHLPWLEKPVECGKLINEFLDHIQLV